MARQDEKSPENRPLTTNEINQILGKRLKEIRKSHHITQQSLGQRLGVSFQQIQKYEKGTSAMRVETLYEICEYLGVHPGFFMYAIPFPMIDQEPTEEKKEINDIQRLVGAVVRFPPDLRGPFVDLCEMIPNVKSWYARSQNMPTEKIEKITEKYNTSPNPSHNPATHQRSFSISFPKIKDQDK